MPAWTILTPAAVFGLSLGGTALLRRYSRRLGTIDVPGHRSSHSLPTPRGGGLPAALLWPLVALALGLSGEMPLRPSLGLLGGGLICALTGWLEDSRGLSKRWRLAMHLIAAACLLAGTGGFARIGLGDWSVEIGWWGIPLALLAIIWFTNLFNFMDGIDGLAGSQALFAAGVLGIYLALTGNWAQCSLAWSLAAGALGFLVWNWPPASIFMGDAGSYGLGFGLAALFLNAQSSGLAPIGAGVLLVLPFVADSTWTIAKRFLRGAPVHQAHREHLYQRLVQAGLSHRAVVMRLWGLNLCLLGLAALVYLRLSGGPFFIAAGVMLTLGYGWWLARWIKSRSITGPRT